MSQTSAWDAFVGTKAPWRGRQSTVWTHWKGRRCDKPRDSSSVGGVEVAWQPRVVDGAAVLLLSQTPASESSSSGDDASMDAAAHEWLQEWDVPEASCDVEREGDADSEPRGLGMDVEDAQVIGLRDHADAAAIAADLGDDAHEDDVREVAFKFPVEHFLEEQLNQELVEEECEGPAGIGLTAIRPPSRPCFEYPPKGDACSRRPTPI